MAIHNFGEEHLDPTWLNQMADAIESTTYGVGHNHNGTNSTGIMPIGAVLPWLKSLAGCPALPSSYVECNGQTLSDAQSPFNGQVVPNLNGASSGTQRFLRGATTSGGTGGEDTHVLAITEMPSHDHTWTTTSTSGSTSNTASRGNASGSYSHPATSNTGGGLAHENRPPYFQVVFVMRIK